MLGRRVANVGGWTARTEWNQHTDRTNEHTDRTIRMCREIFIVVSCADQLLHISKNKPVRNKRVENPRKTLKYFTPSELNRLSA